MISKSSYVYYCGCPKMFWLHLHKKEEASPLEAITLRNIENGVIVNDLALHYFLDTYNASVRTKDNIPEYDKQIENTRIAIEHNVDVIAEASFSIGELFCAVDLLKKDKDGYIIYEVKSSKEVKDKHLPDIAFQKYVLDKCGLKINDVYILHVNKEYVRHGDLNIQEFFKAEKLTDNPFFLDEYRKIPTVIDTIIKLSKDNKEPTALFNHACTNKDGKCPFYKYCHSFIPSKNCVKSINGIRHSEDYYNKGIFTIEDLLEKVNPKLNKRQKVQVDAYLNNKEVYIDKDEIISFLNNLRYPLYYLDFETTSEIIPPFDGMRPGEEYPFQYSLHIEMSPNGEVIHKEFLGEEHDCTRALAEQLIKDIPVGSCTIAFHNSTEKRFVKYLAEKYPDLKEKLISINRQMEDLLYPFEHGHYYHIKQGGSNSIKYVMPALCPKMEDAYHQLPIVHNGGEALAMFIPLVTKLKGTPEYDKVRQGMLDYCCLDTLSMVEIMKVLRKAVEENK